MKKQKSGSRKRKSTSTPSLRGVLGINISAETIDAALLRRVNDRIVVVQRFARPRAMAGRLASATALVTALPGLKAAEDSDYTLQVGDGVAGSPDFIPSEFSDLGANKSESKGEKIAPQSGHAHPFTSQLKEILQECKTLGFGHIELAFCIAPPDVNYVELKLPKASKTTTDKSTASDKAKGERATSNGSISEQDGTDDKNVTAPSEVLSQTDYKRLLQILPEHHPGAIDESRVAFIPLAEGKNNRRILAVIAESTEPVSATLRLLRDQTEDTIPEVRHVNAEVSAYISLFQRKALPDPSEKSAIVRVGSEDTLILFFEGTKPLHVERLRSLSVYDLPETVCSRVILQQDEKKIGELHSVFLVDGGRSETLINAFRSFFPDAAVEPFQSVLTDEDIELTEGSDELMRGTLLPAMVVGIAALEKWPEAGNANLLPRSLRKKQRGRRRIAWHTYAAGILAVLLLAVGIGRFVTTQSRVNDAREELRINPPMLPLESPDLLQIRVDSLATAYATYTRALNVLDSLLIGSDTWIQMMSQVTRTVSSSGDTWLTKWTPEGGVLRLNGSATSRLNIVGLSRRLNAAIEQVTYEDIGGRRVYNFEMITATPAEMPQAALYLRGSLPTVDYDEDDLIIHVSPPLREPNHPHSH